METSVLVYAVDPAAVTAGYIGASHLDEAHRGRLSFVIEEVFAFSEQSAVGDSRGESRSAVE